MLYTAKIALMGSFLLAVAAVPCLAAPGNITAVPTAAPADANAEYEHALLGFFDKWGVTLDMEHKKLHTVNTNEAVALYREADLRLNEYVADFSLIRDQGDDRVRLTAGIGYASNYQLDYSKRHNQDTGLVEKADPNPVYHLGFEYERMLRNQTVGLALWGDWRYAKFNELDYSVLSGAAPVEWDGPGRTNGHAELTRWKAGVRGSMYMDGMVPYGGLYYSDLRLKQHLPYHDEWTDEEKRNLGVQLGMKLELMDWLSGDLHFDFLNEASYGLNLNWKF